MRILKILASAFMIVALAGHSYAGENGINPETIKAEIKRTILETSLWDKSDLGVDSITINGNRAEFESADGFKVEAPSGMKILGR